MLTDEEIDDLYRLTPDRFAFARAIADKAAEREREKRISGVKISIPTDTMEQEIAAHVRRAVAAEREACATLARNKALHCDEHDNPYGASAARDLEDEFSAAIREAKELKA